MECVGESFARLPQPLFDLVDVRVDERVVPLAPAAGDHDCFDVGDAGVQRRGDRIVCRPQVQCSGVDDHEIRLHPTREVANPIVEPEGACAVHGGPLAPLAADRTATLRVGDRAPNADVVDGHGNRVRLFDAYRGPHFTAIAYGAYAADALAKLDWPADGARLNRVIIDSDSKGDIPGGVLTDPAGQFAEIYGLSRDTLLLIRPDGYIGHIAIHNIAETISAAVQPMTPHIVTSAPSKRS
jgi:hypothetical protein